MLGQLTYSKCSKFQICKQQHASATGCEHGCQPSWLGGCFISQDWEVLWPGNHHDYYVATIIMLSWYFEGQMIKTQHSFWSLCSHHDECDDTNADPSILGDHWNLCVFLSLDPAHSFWSLCSHTVAAQALFDSESPQVSSQVKAFLQITMYFPIRSGLCLGCKARLFPCGASDEGWEGCEVWWGEAQPRQVSHLLVSPRSLFLTLSLSLFLYFGLSKASGFLSPCSQPLPYTLQPWTLLLDWKTSLALVFGGLGLLWRW